MTQSGFNTKRPSKCMFGRCEWPYKGFHICVDLSTPEPVIEKSGPVWTAAEKKEIGERVRATAKKRTAERDLKIVELYVEKKMGLKPIAREMGIAYQTVRSALLRNNIKLRPKGYTNSRPGNVHGAFN